MKLNNLWGCREFRKVKGQTWMSKQGDFFGFSSANCTYCLWICCSNPPFSKYWPPYISATHLWWRKDYSTELTVHIWLFPTVRDVQTACLDRPGFSPHLCRCSCRLLSPIYLSDRTLRADAQTFCPSQANPQTPSSVWPLPRTASRHRPEFHTLPSGIGSAQETPELFVDLEHEWQTCSTSRQYSQDKQTGNCTCKYFRTVYVSRDRDNCSVFILYVQCKII